MKKFLVMLLSVLMAFVMCFSFVACGNDDAGNNNGNDDNDTNDPGNDPDDGDNGDDAPDIDVAQKLSAAFENLYTVNGYTGEIKLQSSVRTDEEASESIEISFDKRGDKIKLVVPVSTASDEGEEETAIKMQEMILDLNTGYIYRHTEDGYYFTQPIPANTLDYALAVITENIVQAPAMQYGGSYDNATKTANDTLDIGSYLNGVLQPVYDTYESGTLLNLIDKYIDAYSNDFSSLNDIVEAFTFIVTTAKDQTAGFALEFIQTAYGVDIIEELAGMGIEFDESELAAIENRTVGEMAAGICMFVDDVIESLITEKNPPESNVSPTAMTLDGNEDDYVVSDGGMDISNVMQIVNKVKEVAEEYAFNLAYYALLAPIQIEDFVTVNEKNQKVVNEQKLTDMLNNTTSVLKGALGSFKVKDLVDNFENPMLSFMVENEITFTELKYDYSVTFDDDYNIKTLTVISYLSHSYDETADEQTPAMFVDNGYESKLTLTFGNYTDSTTDFDITLADDQGAASKTLAIVYDLTSDVTVYVESNGATLNATDAAAVLMNVVDGSMSMLTLEDNVITVDGNTVTVKASFIAAALEDADNDSFVVITLAGEEDENVSIVLIPMSTDLETLGDFIQKALGGVIGSMGGGEGNIQGVPQE